MLVGHESGRCRHYGVEVAIVTFSQRRRQAQLACVNSTERRQEKNAISVG